MMSDITVEIKYMLFAGENYYPSGGWGDFQGYFITKEEAIAFIYHGKHCLTI